MVDPDQPPEQEAERFRRWCAGHDVVLQHFCNPNEELQQAAHHWAALVGLPHLPPERVAAVRDKRLMEGALRLRRA